MKNQPSILVCGIGSIGIRHINNLKKLDCQVLAWHYKPKILNDKNLGTDIKKYKNLISAIQDSSAVIIATPTNAHEHILTEALKLNKPIFIEKPISHNLNFYDKTKIFTKNSLLEVGCNFRLHPNLIKLKKILSRINQKDILSYRLAHGYNLDLWRPSHKFKKSYSYDSKRGGGVLLDLIHQIDISLWLFGEIKSVYGNCSNTKSIGVKGDDLTNIITTHKTGLVGHIQLDMVSPVNRCEAEIVTKKCIYKWCNNSGKLISLKNNKHLVISDVSKSLERNDLYLSHMRHFLKRLKSKNMKAICRFDEGIDALNVAIHVKKSNSINKAISVKDVKR